MDRAQFETLGPWIQGWGEPSSAPTADWAAQPSSAANALANTLLGVGILSKQAGGSKDARPTAYVRPTDAVELESVALGRLGRWRHPIAFFVECARASRQLREQRFEAIVAAVQARKRRYLDTGGRFELNRALRLIAIFNRLRLWYPRSYLCLFDSLALVHFLARFDVYPDWVFGVRADPFEAHCWVQAGGIVLNDTVERLSGLTPIMSV